MCLRKRKREREGEGERERDRKIEEAGEILIALNF